MKVRNLILLLTFLSIFITSCVKDEIFQGPPVISELTLNPQAPAENQSVTVSAKVTDLNGVQTVTLFYSNGGAYTQVQMTGSGSIFTAQIPGQASDVTVNFYIEAKNEAGLSAYHPSGAPATTAAYTVGAPLIVMNEIYSRGVPDAPDWIEIYNASDVAVDISGYKIYDAGGQTGAKPKLPIPAGTIIPAKGFYVMVTDVGGDSGFGLSSAGEEVWLENAKGNIIDNYAFGPMDVTQSIGRNPDGSPNWELLNTITKGAPNSAALPDPEIKMNEIFSQGTAESPDWIELYNNSAFEADLAGWKIYDSGGQTGSKPKMTLPAGSVIPAKGFLVVVVDNGSESGFGLSSNGEEVWLEKPAGAISDNITFPALTATQSYGRFPDGSNNLQVLETVTRGAANSNAIPVVAKVVMNEIYSRGTTEAPDWIELFNDGDAEVNISGWLIYDSGGNGGTKPKKAIPEGTMIPAKGFYVIVVDDGTESGFGLSSNGEEVWFAKPDGTVVDNATFPALTETQSFGRFPDGTTNWQVLETITRGTANSTVIPVNTIILMNEIYSRGTPENPDWIEIYNASTVTVNLTGYKIYDSGGNGGTKPKKVIPEGTAIPAGGFYVIVVDDGSASGFGLSSGGEEVWLEKPDGTIIDNLAFPAMDVTQSYGRFPDGSENWQLLNALTPGAPNSNTTAPTVELIHYWHFNNLPSGTLTDPVLADFTAAGVGQSNITYPGTGAGYMDNVSPGSDINARMEQIAGLGLRPRNPANTRELLIVAPSTGYTGLIVTYAAMRSSSGAAQEEFYYSANGGTDWIKVGEAFDIALDWAIHTFDLSSIAAINNNNNLQFKILFVGVGSDGASGNNRLDNISIEGTKRK
jgi:hypothetical protein